MPSYRGYRFPPDIISHAVWLYHRFALSFRDVEDLLARRGVDVTCPPMRPSGSGVDGSVLSMRADCGADVAGSETPGISTRCSSRSRVASNTYGVPWMRTVTSSTSSCNRDEIGTPRCDSFASGPTLLKTQRQVPRRLITDKLRSYSAACRTVMPSVLHCTDQYANNRAEVSHQPTRQRERQMRRFKSAAQLQRFASVHGIVQNLFRVGRHLLRSAHHRLLRTRAFVEWDAVTCAC